MQVVVDNLLIPSKSKVIDDENEKREREREKKKIFFVQ